MNKQKQVVVKSADIEKRVSDLAKRFVAAGQGSAYNEGKRKRNINFNGLDRVTRKNTSERISNMILMESNPLLTRAMEILTGLIVCPNGGHTTVLNYSSEGHTDDKKLTNDAAAVCTVLDKHFTNTVKLQNSLYDMVYKILTIDGSYPTLFIPNSNITALLDDKLGLESMDKSIGIISKPLNNKKFTDNESLLGIQLTDNPNILNKSLANELGLSKKSTVALESAATRKAEKKVNVAKILSRRKIYKENPVLKLNPNQLVEQESRPVIKKVPSESVLPIQFNGDTENTYGYLIILDENGYPIKSSEQVDFDKDLRSMGDEDQLSGVIKKVGNNFNNQEKTPANIKDVYKSYAKMFEQEVFDRLLKGTYTEKFTLKDDSTIMQMMFHRHLAKVKTKVLFVPDQLMNYACFDKDEHGVGKSFISRTKLLSTLSTVLFFSNFMGSMANATPSKTVTVDFDAADVDHNKTMEQVINEVVMRQVGTHNFNFDGPSDIIDGIQRAGLDFKFNNLQDSDMPDMNIDIEHKRREKQPISEEFQDRINKMISMRLGFSSQVIDDSYSPDFSSQVIRDNELTARQISRFVNMSSDFLTDYVVKNTLADPILIESCFDAIKSADKEATLEAILENLIVSTPTAETSGLTEATEELENVVSTIELVLGTMFPDSMSDNIENMGVDHMVNIREKLMSVLMTEYLNKSSQFRFLMDRIRSSDDIKNLVQVESERVMDLIEVFEKHTKDIVKTDTKVNKRLEAWLDKLESGEVDEEGVDNTPTPTETPEVTDEPDTGGVEDTGTPELPEV